MKAHSIECVQGVTQSLVVSLYLIYLKHLSTFTPRSMSFFFRRGLARLVPTLPSVRESPEYIFLSSSDDEGDDPKSSFCVKQEVVDGMDAGVPYILDDTLLSDDDGSPPLSSPSYLSLSLRHHREL
jgi:hypothetical protein